MLTAPHAFVLGHAVPIIGIYFRAVDLLTSAADGGFARGRELLDSLDGRKAGTTANVRRVESLLAEIPATVGEPPRTNSDYDAWAQRILDAVEQTVKPADPIVATVHLVGRQVGSALQHINLAVYELTLIAANAGDSQLTGMLDQERADLARIARSLRGASVASPANGETLGFADELDRAHLSSVGDAQALMKRCSDRMAKMEAAYS
ncbi:MAG TPA: hypothetical protein VH143_29555 [Kofleriaceae bacterium]|nr:hypothetical protein [Kofleriaceae bacterium]